MVIERIDKATLACLYDVAEVVVSIGNEYRTIARQGARYLAEIVSKAQDALQHCNTVRVVLKGGKHTRCYYYGVNDNCTKQETFAYCDKNNMFMY